MFKNKALSCMLALGLTLSSAPAVLAGPDDTAGNSTAVDKTENPSDAPTTTPGEESSGTTTEGSTPQGELPKPEGEGTLPAPGEETTPDSSTTPGGETTPDSSTTPGEGTTDGSTTTGGTTTDSSTSLPQTGAPVALLAPILLVGGAAGVTLYKRGH